MKLIKCTCSICGAKEITDLMVNLGAPPESAICGECKVRIGNELVERMIKDFGKRRK